MYTKEGLELSGRSAEFMKKQAAIESDYGKNMLKLVKQYQAEEQKRILRTYPPGLNGGSLIPGVLHDQP